MLTRGEKISNVHSQAIIEAATPTASPIRKFRNELPAGVPVLGDGLGARSGTIE